MQKLHKRCLMGAVLAMVLLIACGCTTNPPATPTSAPTVSATVQPTLMATQEPTAAPSMQPAEAAGGTLAITVDGKEITEKGITKDNTTWLPLEAVAKALGYTVQKNNSTDAAAQEWTITQANDAANTIKVSYKVNDNTMSDSSVTKTGNTLTLENPLMMEGTVLYASEKVFTEALMAKVTTDAAANKVTVDKGTPAT